jgi:hypothetical protein
MTAARWIRRKATTMALLVGAAVPAADAAAGQLTLTSSLANVTGGGAFTLTVSLAKQPGETLTAVSMDLAFEAGTVAATSCAAGTAAASAGKSLVQRVVRPGLLRVGVWGLNNNAIPDGVLFTCQMRATTFARPGASGMAGSSDGASGGGGSAAMSAGFAQVSVRADGDGDGVPVSGTLARCTGGQVAGCSDNCPAVSNPGQADSDGDGVGDACDLCGQDPNPPILGEQLDTDGNGVGNRCDCDFDGDGACDGNDFQVFVADFESGRDSGAGTDKDGDGVVDVRDYRLLVRSLTR